MAGTGQGALQPTKLIQNDDFMETLALPGYIQSGSTTLAANLAIGATNTILFTVPDGMTAEVLDAGVTFTSAEALDGSNKISLGITSVTYVAGTGYTRDKDIVAPTALVANGTVGYTHSIGRGDFSFNADSTAVSNQFGAGSVFAYELTLQAGTTTTLGGTVWIRVKWIKKDNGSI